MNYADGGLTGTDIVQISCQGISYIVIAFLSGHLRLYVAQKLFNGLLYCRCLDPIQCLSMVHFHVHQLMNTINYANGFTELAGTC